jgi:hypothetical protein
VFLKTKFRKKLSAYRHEIREKPHEIVRLQKLENAVKNYSGGIYTLHERVNTLLQNGNLNNETTALLLKDISVYLRDLKIAGQLERDYFSHAGDDC